MLSSSEVKGSSLSKEGRSEEELYRVIRKLQQRVFGAVWPKENITEYVQQYITMIQVEAVEVLQETNFKAHRAPKPVDMAKLKEEIIDIQVFLYAMASGIFGNYEEYLSVLREKVEKNERRNDWEINTEEVKEDV
jgi:dimeric dUTPase (all-alpha-NTP-PPase superfamily)